MTKADGELAAEEGDDDEALRQLIGVLMKVVGNFLTDDLVTVSGCV